MSPQILDLLDVFETIFLYIMRTVQKCNSFVCYIQQSCEEIDGGDSKGLHNTHKYTIRDFTQCIHGKKLNRLSGDF